MNYELGGTLVVTMLVGHWFDYAVTMFVTMLCRALCYFSGGIWGFQ